MLYADNATVFSQSPAQFGKMNIVIVLVTVWASFGLTLFETKTAIMCLRTRVILDAAAAFNFEAAGQVQKVHDFVYLWGSTSRDTGLSVEFDRRSFQTYTSELHDRPSTPPEKIRMQKTELLEALLYSHVT